jgi:hypothetical protein
MSFLDELFQRTQQQQQRSAQPLVQEPVQPSVDILHNQQIRMIPPLTRRRAIDNPQFLPLPEQTD